MQRRGTRLIAGLSVVIAAVVVAVLVIRSSPSSASRSGKRAAGTTGGSATVRRRNLVATDTESGTLSYAGAQTVYNRLGGTVTWLPPVGRRIEPGGVLYRIDGRPVILMSGSAPAYRTLSAADVTGHDVLELNRNLKRLGFDAAAITVDDQWQPATSLGVEELQESLGEEPTGSLTLGQVVFLPGPQLVSALDTTVGSTGSGGGASASAQDSGTSPLAGSAEFVSSTSPATSTTATRTTTTTTPTVPAPTTTTTTPTVPAPTTTTTTTTPSTPETTTTRSDGSDKALSALAKQLKAETSQLKAATSALKAAAKSAARSSSSTHHSGGKGGSGGSAQAILQTTSTRLVVTVDLSASSQSEARVGERVTVEMPSGDTVKATIIAVSRVAQASSSAAGGGGSGVGGGSSAGGGSGADSGASSTVPVTIALSGHHRSAGLDQAAVSVNFVSERARNVLSVPVTALVATSGARYALQEASAPHSLLPVTVGLFAAGYVEVSGSGIHAGLAVTDSQG